MPLSSSSISSSDMEAQSRQNSQSAEENGRSMRRFALRSLVFLVPFLFYGLAIALIDPFQLFPLSHLISENRKAPIAGQMNGCIWKMEKFLRHPLPNIVLGDSRMDAISVDDIRKVNGQEYFNFSYGGASLNEITDSFWFAAAHTHLEHVYIGLNLNVYNDYNASDRAAAFKAIDSQPVLYFFDRNVLQAAYYDVLSAFLHRDLKLGAPQMGREEFWKQQLGGLTDAYYSRYMLPVVYRRKLAEISRYSRDHKIALTFIIPPTHVSLQHRVHDFHLESANARLREDLRDFGPTIDFDYPTDLTLQADHFSDPYHLKREFLPVLVREIWGPSLLYGTKYPTSEGGSASS